MIHKPLADITKADIDELVSSETQESKTLEFKEKIGGWGDDAKKEFLADVSALANSDGGDLIFGIKERRIDGKPSGEPEEACGVEGDVGAEVTRIVSTIRDGIEPHIPSVEVKEIPGFRLGSVIVIRIGKSWASPHMVTFKSRMLFWSRSSVGKFPMDIGGIRSAFTSSEVAAKRVETFVIERTSKILSGEAPVQLPSKATVLLHLIPIGTFQDSGRIKPKGLTGRTLELAPLHSDFGLSTRINLDGFLTYAVERSSATHPSYAQFFRNGIIESIGTEYLNEREGKKYIPFLYLEKELLDATTRYLAFYRTEGIPPPVELRLTLLGAKGFEMYPDRMFMRNSSPIDRDTLNLPGILIDDLTQPSDTILRPVLDSLWNACGYGECPNYNAEGRWYERRN